MRKKLLIAFGATLVLVATVVPGFSLGGGSQAASLAVMSDANSGTHVHLMSGTIRRPARARSGNV